MIFEVEIQSRKVHYHEEQDSEQDCHFPGCEKME